MSSFDADALERAAKFARELERSKNARGFMELSKREQEIRMREAEKEKEQAKADAQKAAVAGERVRWEEQRKTIEFNKQQQIELERAKMARDMELQREEDKLARQRNADLVAMQNKAAAEREAMRRQTEREIQDERRRTDERRAALERENMKARALAEAEGRIREQRQNEDIYVRQIKLRGEQTRTQIKEAIETTFASLGSTLSAFIMDREKVTRTILGLTVLAAGVFAMREGSRVAGRVLEKRLLTPSLVRETSRSTGHFGMRRALQRRLGLLPAEEVGFQGVVLEGQLDQRVLETAVATGNTRSHGAPFRHMLFYGPPGTGKTMVAKRLARTSGLDYAIMTGGDVGPLGRESVTELHRLFDWGETSRRGLLLFIDEADAFLASRSRKAMSEEQRNALNALLYRTGEASRNIMLVLATNRPGDLDRAVVDRVDETLMFGMPDHAGRVRLLEIYFDKYLRRAGQDAPRRGPLGILSGKRAAHISIGEGFDEAFFQDLARRTEGLSGRAISKLMLSVQGAVYGRESAELTMGLMEEVIEYKLKEFVERGKFAERPEEFDFTDQAGGAFRGDGGSA